ncbi:hypothetical protein [Klebsiella variicola]|uniref:LexA family protein n=1 Tax=Klebsiella variicola TaxID=244366 RepID=UPI003A4DEDDC
MTQTTEVSKSHQTGAPSTSAGLLSSSKLTFRQQEVFDLLVAYINQHGYPPTLSELAGMLGVSSSTGDTPIGMVGRSSTMGSSVVTLRRQAASSKAPWKLSHLSVISQ